MKTSTPPEIEQQPTTWIARVNLGRQMRDAGEKMVADALRERLDKVGEARWLKECDKEWGWSRTTAYRHLNPELLQKDRDRAAARYENRNIPKLTEVVDIAAENKRDRKAIAKILGKPPLTRLEPPADLIRTKPTWSCCAPRRVYWMGKVEHWKHYYDCPTERAKVLEPIITAIQEGRVRAVPDCAGNPGMILESVELEPERDLTEDDATVAEEWPEEQEWTEAEVEESRTAARVKGAILSLRSAVSELRHLEACKVTFSRSQVEYIRKAHLSLGETLAALKKKV